ncbi:MAG: protein of unknown function DUF1360, partial [uncultured Nocardioidaceae bacterium]
AYRHCCPSSYRRSPHRCRLRERRGTATDRRLPAGDGDLRLPGHRTDARRPGAWRPTSRPGALRRPRTARCGHVPRQPAAGEVGGREPAAGAVHRVHGAWWAWRGDGGRHRRRSSARGGRASDLSVLSGAVDQHAAGRQLPERPPAYPLGGCHAHGRRCVGLPAAGVRQAGAL